MEIIQFTNDKCYLINKIKINKEHSLIISRLKNCKLENFTFNIEDNLWYYQNYKLKIRLLELLYPNSKNSTFTFINNNSNDYREKNIKINIPKKYSDIFPEPLNYTILEYGSPYHITNGKYAGQYRNMYWKVKDKNLIYYIMHIKDNIYTKISSNDINKVLFFKNDRSSYYIHSNGYIATTTNSDRLFYYLHQLIMDVHDEDLSDYKKTVDHINHDKLDNRKENLRLVNMSIQNSNRDKSERRIDACDLPEGISQSDLPKYVCYRKEILNKDNGRYREYFYICNHPKLNRWISTKSNKINLKDKLNLVIKKLEKLDSNDSESNSEQEQESSEKSNTSENPNLVLPKNISLIRFRNENHFVYDYKQNDIRYNLKMIIKTENIQNELLNFINKLNKKYPNLKLNNDNENNNINNNINNNDINNNDTDNENNNENINNNINENNNDNNNDNTDNINNNEIKLKLPINFSFYKEKNQYYFQYSKVFNKIKYSKKITILSNDLQLEFNKFIELVNTTYPNLKIDNYIIPNIPSNINIIFNNNETNIKPIMPNNFSITTINNIDYIQFCKKINDKKYQYKVKINSYDIQNELNKFINSLNTNYNLNLDNLQYIINNKNNWKTTNKIINHKNPTELQLKNREKTLKSLNKKKELLGEEEFKNQKNDYMKKYNLSKK